MFKNSPLHDTTWRLLCDPSCILYHWRGKTPNHVEHQDHPVEQLRCNNSARPGVQHYDRQVKQEGLTCHSHLLVFRNSPSLKETLANLINCKNQFGLQFAKSTRNPCTIYRQIDVPPLHWNQLSHPPSHSLDLPPHSPQPFSTS
jgi:hypothetical protein